jgi:hypothetical protein
MARPVKKQISAYLVEKLQEQEKTTGRPFNRLLADELVRIALDPGSSNKDKLAAISIITDRIEGKPIQTNLNADVTENPFEGIDTAKLEALKAKLTADVK